MEAIDEGQQLGMAAGRRTSGWERLSCGQARGGGQRPGERGNSASGDRKGCMLVESIKAVRELIFF